MVASMFGSATRSRCKPCATAIPRSSRKARISLAIAVRSLTRRELLEKRSRFPRCPKGIRPRARQEDRDRLWRRCPLYGPARVSHFSIRSGGDGSASNAMASLPAIDTPTRVPVGQRLIASGSSDLTSMRFVQIAGASR